MEESRSFARKANADIKSSTCVCTAQGDQAHLIEEDVGDEAWGAHVLLQDPPDLMKVAGPHALRHHVVVAPGRIPGNRIAAGHGRSSQIVV